MTVILPTENASSFKTSKFTTGDGARLHIVETGGVGENEKAPTIIMLPGWSQTAAMFGHQLYGLPKQSDVHCIAMDLRGHGESDKVKYGHRISRLAMDLREFIVERNLSDVTLLGHSMGCQIMWSYWDMFRAIDHRLKAFVIVDQPAAYTVRDNESEERRMQSGSITSWQNLMVRSDECSSPEYVRHTTEFVHGMCTSQASSALKAWVVEENLKFPREDAVALLVNSAIHDWRDVLQFITLPTLIIGGEAGNVPIDSLKWMQSQIKGSLVEVFGVNEGGNHLTFLENPIKFNNIFTQFLNKVYS
eukprot:CFRG3687T1